jgi:hypothetical protein
MNVKRTEVFQDVFGTVKVGEAFSVPYGHTIYIKTDVYMKPQSPACINAIDLSNGVGRYFRETDLVILHEDAVAYSEE